MHPPASPARYMHTPADQSLMAFVPLPFQLQLDLMPMIRKWREMMQAENALFSAATKKEFEDTLANFPFLSEPIHDLSVLKPHQKFLEQLVSIFLPMVDLSTVFMAITAPFSPWPAVYATKSYQKLILAHQEDDQIGASDYGEDMLDFRMLYAYKFILKKFYNFDLNVDQPIRTYMRDKDTELLRYFKLLGTGNYMDVFSLAPLPELKPHQLQELLMDRFKEEKLKAILPPENFLISGSVIVSLVDVTTEESISKIQYSLLNLPQDNLWNWFEEMQKEVRNLFKLPEIRMGIATIQQNGEFNFTSQNPLWNSLMLKETEINPTEVLHHSIYQQVIREGKLFIIEDLNDEEYANDPLLQAIRQKGYSNLLLTPVVDGNKIIGMLELASPVPGRITGLSLLKINQLKPILSIAQRRLLEEFENRVEAVMMQQFTSIHPAVSWRFRDAAIHLIDNQKTGINVQTISFDDVLPFYGSLDIRESSKKRNKSIERDLTFNLQKAHEILQHGFEKLSFDILGELMHQVECQLENIECSFNTREESSVVDFICREVNPVIHHLHREYPGIHHVTKFYVQHVPTDVDTFTMHRSGYEAALGKVNLTISQHLDKEEQALQKLYPCLFEKFQTDGVEYNIYTGASIARGRKLDMLYLDNLRLRQLIWTCNIIKDVNALEPDLHQLMHTSLNGATIKEQEKIEIAPLILAYGNPISLRFRQDEKRLDVDGSYNIRYEIMKKRIDKAVIQGTSERLTQPGAIAIVYSHDNELNAYQKHFEYLCKKGYIEEGQQDFLLEPLQGVEGLKAVRVMIPVV